MSKLNWYVNRLKAMSAREVIWRLRQKRLQKEELRRFKDPQYITTPLYHGVDAMVEGVVVDTSYLNECKKLFGNISGNSIMEIERIELLGPFNYEDFATDWHAGFNTANHWGLQPSYKLNYKQVDTIGDARINWELNRHRQFTRLAYAYCCAKETESGLNPADILSRLSSLVDDWSEKNPFLIGISWTSPMEIAIRAISWMTAARLIAAYRSAETKSLTTKLLTGAANMIAYLRQHESGFSSANNHLIVEVCSVAIAGFLFNKPNFVEESVSVMTRELKHQVSSDGVDLESSLHYHGFVMEAYLLVAHEMKLHGKEIPSEWVAYLKNMAHFVEASHVKDDNYCIFGDDDEARIFDLTAGNRNYFNNLLKYFSYIFPESSLQNLPASLTFADGGYSFYRSGKTYVGIDHAPLGFGSIAAHGHADTLSFQYFINGEPMLIDSGTYLYHVDLPRRNLLRSSMLHNTVTIDRKEQSQMLGAFLWGKKAETELINYTPNSLKASVKGLSGKTHYRNFNFAKDELTITDSFSSPCEWIATFILNPGLEVSIQQNTASIRRAGAAQTAPLFTLTSDCGKIETEVVEVAKSYGSLTQTTAIRIGNNGSTENRIILKAL